jgi:hypothetical protein
LILSHWNSTSSMGLLTAGMVMVVEQPLVWLAAK